MVRANMRTSPNQPILSRPVRAKHSLKSKLSQYGSKAPVNIPGYVLSVFPDADLPTRRAMVGAVERYLGTPEGQTHGMPSPAMLRMKNGILEGLID